MKKNKVLRTVIMLLFYVIALLAIILLAFTLTEYKPQEKENIFTSSRSSFAKDTLTVLSWNIGYCGLGEDMDFFYEGGKQVRCSEERTRENMQAISNVLNKHKECDFFFLQEVDVNSRRTYSINELNYFSAALPDMLSFFAYNYRAPFVPLPLTGPMGKVEAGQCIYSNGIPTEVSRYAYPNTISYPKRLFLLKNCFLVACYKLVNGKELVLINTHNSAFREKEQARQEMELLKEFVTSEYKKGNYVIAGGDWNQVPNGYNKETYDSPYFTPYKMPTDVMPDGWQWSADYTLNSNRYLYEPYKKGSTETVLLDYFLLSPNVECTWVKTLDYEFKHSDHNPIKGKFVLR